MHTPAPWETSNHFYIVDRSGVIAEVDRHAWTTAEEVQANARLIAAAPELLEALKTVTDELEHLYNSCDDGWGSWKHGEMIEDARAAIEKVVK